MLSEVYSANAISERVKDIANSINNEYKDEKIIHVVVTLNGSFMFAADLIREVKIPMEVHFAGTASYSGREKQDMRINPDAFPKSFGNAPVIIVEDIVDSGATIKQLRTLMAERFASNIKIASLLRRQGGEGKPDWFGFTVPKNLFVVGYGMDMDGRFRELSDIKAISAATTSGLC